MLIALRCETTATKLATMEMGPPTVARLAAMVAPPGLGPEDQFGMRSRAVS